MGTPVQFIKLIPNEEKKELKYLLLGIDMRTKLIYRFKSIYSDVYIHCNRNVCRQIIFGFKP